MTQSAITFSALETSERPLFGEQTVGSLVRNVWRVYREHFLLIALTYFLPTFPLVVFAQMVRGSSPGLELALLFAYTVSQFVAGSALTVTVSDICLGTVPTVRRSYSRVLRGRTWLRVLTTGVLVLGLFYLGLLLLFVPGIWFAARAMFSSTIVILEGRSGRKAIRRSFDLTRGQFWRLLGLMMLFCLPPLVIGIFGATGASAAGATYAAEALMNLLTQGLMVPAVGIATVLLYYDQRVRRELYDAHALSEDLMR